MAILNFAELKFHLNDSLYCVLTFLVYYMKFKQRKLLIIKSAHLINLSQIAKSNSVSTFILNGNDINRCCKNSKHNGNLKAYVLLSTFNFLTVTELLYNDVKASNRYNKELLIKTQIPVDHIYGTHHAVIPVRSQNCDAMLVTLTISQHIEMLCT